MCPQEPALWSRNLPIPRAAVPATAARSTEQKTVVEAGASWASGRVSPGAGRQTEVPSESQAKNIKEGRRNEPGFGAVKRGVLRKGELTPRLDCLPCQHHENLPVLLAALLGRPALPNFLKPII